MTERKRTKEQDEFEDTKGAIRIRISKKNRQHNDQKKKGQKDMKSLKIPKRQSESTLLVVLLSFFLSVIVLSVLLRYTDSDCPFGIFKLFLSFCPFSFGQEQTTQ
jgi:hypothetical protein